MRPDQRIEQLAPRRAFHLLLAALDQILANLATQFGQRRELTRGLGELVVDRRQHLLLDSLDVHAVAERPSLQTLARVVFRVGHFKLSDVARTRATQVLGKFREGPLAA